MRRMLIRMTGLFGLFCLTACNAPRPDAPVGKQTWLYAVKAGDSLRLDRYVRQTEHVGARPCMIFLFGGGFFTGTRDDEAYLPYFDYLCRKGFDVVSIDYRLGLKPLVGNTGAAGDAEHTELAAPGLPDAERFVPLFVEALRMAVEDLYDATAFVVAHAAEWGVDPQRIAACGSSAGAVTVLMGEYGICNASPLVQQLPAGFDYAGIISFAGAIFENAAELHWAKTPAPMLLFHGDADRNVPYGAVRYGGMGFFGSEYIARQLGEARIPHYFYSAADTDHAMAVTPMNDNRYEIDIFLDRLVFGREPLVIDTRVTPTDRPEVPKDFTLADYFSANFGGL